MIRRPRLKGASGALGALAGIVLFIVLVSALGLGDTHGPAALGLSAVLAIALAVGGVHAGERLTRRWWL